MANEEQRTAAHAGSVVSGHAACTSDGHVLACLQGTRTAVMINWLLKGCIGKSDMATSTCSALHAMLDGTWIWQTQKTCRSGNCSWCNRPLCIRLPYQCSSASSGTGRSRPATLAASGQNCLITVQHTGSHWQPTTGSESLRGQCRGNAGFELICGASDNKVRLVDHRQLWSAYTPHLLVL